MCYGYRVDEVKLPDLPPSKLGFEMRDNRVPVDLRSRRPVGVAEVGMVNGVALPHPDPTCPNTIKAGVRKRFARRPPPANARLLSEFKRFVRNWCRKNLVPLDPSADTSVESWLEKTSYPRWRKDALMQVHKDCLAITKDETTCRSFMKDETYAEFKHARAINSRDDAFKIFSGPIFKLIEEELFKNPMFIKHVPVKDRPRYILEALDAMGAKFGATDFTTFEALQTKEVMEAGEMELYQYMTQFLPGGEEWFQTIHDAMTGLNVCIFKYITVKLPATRMSGEMCTSLGNGFLNAMVYLFVCSKSGVEGSGIFEGDDGITRENGDLDATLFSQLGLDVKLEKHPRISDASFCGLIFDPVDLQNITEPMEAICNVAWMAEKYAASSTRVLKCLVRCKALSLAHQYPGCPIVSEFAHRLLWFTRSYNVDKYVHNERNTYLREQQLEALREAKTIRKIEPGRRTRMLMEDIFKISVEQQLEIEKAIASWDPEGPLKLNPDLIPQAWKDYTDVYVATPGAQPLTTWFDL